MLKLAPHLSLPLSPGEALTSYCSRVASKVSLSARRFSLHVGVPFQRIVDGEAEAIEMLAEACCVDPAPLANAAIVKLEPRRHRVGGDVFARDSLQRANVRICPRCLLDDLDRDGHHGPYGRLEWQLEAVRDCPRHGRLLVAMPTDSDAASLHHDFAGQLRLGEVDLEELELGTPEVAPSPLAQFVRDRIAGVASANWLSKVPVYAVAKFAEVLGLAMIDGVHRPWPGVTNLEWQRAGTRGFETLSAGPGALRDYFADLQNKRVADGHGWAFKETFGRLYAFMSHNSPNGDYDVMRKVLIDHVVDTCPVGPGDSVAGRMVSVRKVHSIRSAALELDLHPKTLRKQLLAARVIDAASSAQKDDTVIFDVAAAAALLGQLKEAMSRNAAARYLGIPRPHDVTVFKMGWIRSVITAGQGGVGEHQFTKGDLDAFMTRMTAHATPFAKEDIGYVWVGEAGASAARPTIDVLQLLFDGALRNVRLSPNHQGLRAILVNQEEVHQKLERRLFGLSAMEVASRLGSASGVAVALMDNGILPSSTEVHPVSNRPTRVVSESDLARFLDTWVSLSQLSVELQKHRRTVLHGLSRLRVQPAFDRKVVGASFYSRASLVPKMAELTRLVA